MQSEALEFVESVAYPTFGTILLGGLSDSRNRIPLHTSAGLAYTGLESKIETRTMIYIVKGEPVGYFNRQKMEYSEEYRSPFAVMKEMSLNILGRFNLNPAENSLCFDSENIGILSGSSDSGAAALGRALIEMNPGGKDIDMEKFENRLRVVSESVGRSLYGGLTITERTGSRCFTRQILSPEAFSDFVVLGCRFNETRKPSDAIHTNIVKSSEYEARVKRTADKAVEMEKLAKNSKIQEIFELSMHDTDEYHRLIESVGVKIINKGMAEVINSVNQYRRESWASYIVTGGTNVFVPVHRSEYLSLRERLSGLCDEIVPLKIAEGARIIGKSF